MYTHWHLYQSDNNTFTPIHSHTIYNIEIYVLYYCCRLCASKNKK